LPTKALPASKLTTQIDNNTPNKSPPRVGYHKILEAYEKEHVDPAEEYEPTPEEIGKWRFDQRRDTGKQLRHAINQIYRVKVGSKEFILYNEIQKSEDKMGNELSHPQLVGRYQHPDFLKRYDEESGHAVSASLNGTRTVYEIPFSRENIQEILEMETEDSDPQLVVASGRVKYSGMYNIHDFMNRSFEDLMTKGQTGQYPTTITAAEPKIKEVKKGLLKVEPETEEPSVIESSTKREQ